MAGTRPIGNIAGTGGVIVQQTNKSITVILNTLCGTITMNAAALAAATAVTFTVTNDLVETTDCVHTQHDSGGTIGAYTITANTMATGSFKITVRNNTSGSLSQAVVIRFIILKAVIS
jgi:hypothetical protein